MITSEVLMKLILSLAVLFLSPAVFAATWNEKCPNLARCIQAMTEISGQKYLYSRDVGEVKVAFSRNFPFSSEEADLVFTMVLEQSGLSRIRVKDGAFLVLRANDAKGKDLPLLKADQKNAPDLPETYDLVTLEYRFSYPELGAEAENVVRTHCNVGARITRVDRSGVIFITDSAKALKRVYQMLQSLDVKPRGQP